jgi:hypothetical protein
MVWVLTQAFLAGTLLGAIEPPPPDPKDPVDYVAWVNAEFGKDLVDNAAGLYRQAGEALVKNEDLSRLAATPVRVWSPEQVEAVKAHIARNQRALDLLADAAATRRCHFRLDSQNGFLIGALLKNPDLRALTRILALRGQVRLAAGDVDAAVQDVVTLLAVARHLESQPTLVEYHAGLAVRTLACSLLLEIPQSPVPNIDFAAIVTRVERSDIGAERPQLQYKMERIVAWDTAQRTLKDKNGDGQYTAEGRVARPDGRISSTPEVVFGPRTWEEVLRDINSYFDDLDTVAGLDYPQALDAAAKLADRVKAEEHSFMRQLSPHRTLALRYHARALAHDRGAMLVLYLHDYHAKHGRWPSDLKTMLPVTEQPLAIDPFSGRPFVYRVEIEGPRLYSVSENGQDDGGERVLVPPGTPMWEKTGDYVFWPPAR